jgi:hypothetical protein
MMGDCNHQLTSGLEPPAAITSLGETSIHVLSDYPSLRLSAVKGTLRRSWRNQTHFPSNRLVDEGDTPVPNEKSPDEMPTPHPISAALRGVLPDNRARAPTGMSGNTMWPGRDHRICSRHP